MGAGPRAPFPLATGAGAPRRRSRDSNATAYRRPQPRADARNRARPPLALSPRTTYQTSRSGHAGGILALAFTAVFARRYLGDYLSPRTRRRKSGRRILSRIATTSIYSSAAGG